MGVVKAAPCWERLGRRLILAAPERVPFLSSAGSAAPGPHRPNSGVHVQIGAERRGRRFLLPRTQQLPADVSFLHHYTFAAHPGGHYTCVCVCVCSSGALPGAFGALLIRQAEEKLCVFLLHQLQPLLRSCEQLPKLKDLLDLLLQTYRLI